jgi:transposase-like protein
MTSGPSIIDGAEGFVRQLATELTRVRAARAFFARALQAGPAPVEVTTDRAPVYRA